VCIPDLRQARGNAGETRRQAGAVQWRKRGRQQKNVAWSAEAAGGTATRNAPASSENPQQQVIARSVPGSRWRGSSSKTGAGAVQPSRRRSSGDPVQR